MKILPFVFYPSMIGASCSSTTIRLTRKPELKDGALMLHKYLDGVEIKVYPLPKEAGWIAIHAVHLNVGHRAPTQMAHGEHQHKRPTQRPTQKTNTNGPRRAPTQRLVDWRLNRHTMLLVSSVVATCS